MPIRLAPKSPHVRGFVVLGRLGAVPLSAVQMGLRSDRAMCATSPESMATRALGVNRIGMVYSRISAIHSSSATRFRRV